MRCGRSSSSGPRRTIAPTRQGQYRQVSRLVLSPECIPSDAHFFRVEAWLVALVVSEKVKNAMEEVGCLGAEFVELAT
jgi:hypothetical protein